MSLAALRILHVVPYYEHAWAYGGIPRLATTMTRALARRGHDVTVCTTDVCDAHSRHRPGARVPATMSTFACFATCRTGSRITCSSLRPSVSALTCGTAVRSFDVAHLHACHNLPGAIAAAALARASVPYVVSPNGTALPIERRILAKRAFAATAGRHVLTGAARVLAVTNVERQQLTTLGVPRSRIVVVPNPVEDASCRRRRTRLGFGARTTSVTGGSSSSSAS